MAFAALRLVTGIECGYAHTFLKPIGWSPGYDGRLARIVPGAIIRRYPTSFDNWGWLVERSPVSDSQLAEVRHALSQLDAAPSNLQLAARRLSAAMLREDEEDAVIDVCIGLEAALGDESTTEMTHKLALRTAAVIAAAGADAAHDPLKTFNRTKRLYAWRSKLVHGGMGAKKAREKLEQLADGEPGLAIAVRLLRDGLGAVLARPNLQSSRAVDEELILAGLAQPEDSETA
jgi:hypothetical protein